MKLKTQSEAGKTLFLDVDADDREVYALPESGGSFPEDMVEIVREFELVGEVVTARVDGGSGWNSQMIGRLERRRTDLKNALMEQCKKEIKENDRTESTTS